MMRRLVLACALAALSAAAAPAQQGSYRFDITAVGDSTISFRVADAPWVSAGMKGIAVDPARHDALVARIQVLRITGTLATAVVTGQTSRVTTDYVALLEPPKKKWYQNSGIWIGGAIGIALGVIIAR
jgi:hypothetical protein